MCDQGSQEESAALALWRDVLGKSEKAAGCFGGQGDVVDFAGKFRKFGYFYMWLLLNRWEPGMAIRRIDPCEPWGPKNCEIYAAESCTNTREEIIVDGMSLADISKKYGIAKSTLRYRYLHLGARTLEALASPKNGADIVVEGMPLADISKKYGIAKSTLLYRYKECGARTLEAITQTPLNRARHIDGKTVREISAETGISKSTLIARIQRGVSDLASLTGNRPAFTNPDGTLCKVDSDTNKRLYSIYSAMKQRCYKPNCASYPDYGGRGITVCDRWRYSFPEFRAWALSHGYALGLTIDRVDPDGNYCPANCRWATWTEQAVNHRGSAYSVLRLRAREACAWLEKYPARGIVTIIVRNDLMPPGAPKEHDYDEYLSPAQDPGDRLGGVNDA